MPAPTRMCIGCRQRRPKRNLIKIVFSSLGEIEIDLNQRADGRGAYICSNEECFNAAANFKKLNRAFRNAISPEAIAKFRSKLLEFRMRINKPI